MGTTITLTNATSARSTCPATCTGPGIRDLAYTPYLDKVLATIWWSDALESKLMVLDPSRVPDNYPGTILNGASYFSVPDSSILGPEGIGVGRLFDREADRISDLLEAFNVNGVLQVLPGGTHTVTQYLDPVAWDSVTSAPNQTSGFIGGFQLPEEGIGYRHFYGTATDFNSPDGDSWGTLKMIQIIEAVGREWYLKHPEGPRISINDISSMQGPVCWDEWCPVHQRVEKVCHHNIGWAADLRYIRSDGTENNFTFGIDPVGDYDGISTQDLVNLFCKMGIRTICTDPQGRDLLVAPAGCDIVPTDEHEDHIHIQLN